MCAAQALVTVRPGLSVEGMLSVDAIRKIKWLWRTIALAMFATIVDAAQVTAASLRARPRTRLRRQCMTFPLTLTGLPWLDTDERFSKFFSFLRCSCGGGGGSVGTVMVLGRARTRVSGNTRARAGPHTHTA